MSKSSSIRALAVVTPSPTDGEIQPFFRAIRVMEPERVTAINLLEATESTRVETRQRAAALLWRARARSRTLRESAKADAIHAVEQARTSAYAHAADSASRLLAQLSEKVDHCLRGVERHTWECAIMLAKRILGEEINEHPEHLRTLLQSAMKSAGDPLKARVLMNPADAAWLEEHGATKDGNSSGAALRIVSNPNVPRGTVQVEADGALFDASIETQLLRLRRCIQESLQSGVHSNA